MSDGRRPPGPLRRAVVELTNRCNLRCPHCASDSGVARPGELTTDEWRRVLGELGELGCFELTLLGGEVFLHPDWEVLARTAREQGMELIVISNGLLLDDATVARLADVAPLLVGVSLDGPDVERYRRARGVDGFERAMAALDRLVAAGTRHVNAITTFTRSTLGWWEDFASLFDGGPVTWQVQLANKGGSRFDEEEFVTLEDYARFVEQAKQTLERRPELPIRFMDDLGYHPLTPDLAFLHQTWKGCLAGRELVGIRSDGKVSPCLSLGDAFLLGDLRQESLAEIWRCDRRWRAFRDKHRHLEGACARCPHGEECRAGCTAMALSASGRMGDNPCCIRRLEEAEITGGLWG